MSCPALSTFDNELTGLVVLARADHPRAAWARMSRGACTSAGLARYSAARPVYPLKKIGCNMFSAGIARRKHITPQLIEKILSIRPIDGKTSSFFGQFKKKFSAILVFVKQIQTIMRENGSRG